MIKKLTSENFNEIVKGNDKPIFIDFYADWCGPCKMAAPIVEQLAQELDGQAVICKVNVDTEATLAQQFGISSIPTFVVIKDSKVINRFSGLRNKEQIKSIIFS